MADRVHDRSSIVSCGETAQSHLTGFPIDENLSHLCRKGGHRSVVVISIQLFSEAKKLFFGRPCSPKCGSTGHPGATATADTAVERNSGISVEYVDPNSVGITVQLLRD